ncbi:MAG: PatB family C-S lyase [Anaerolineaceae bacterium]|nr:PatB family C-S lyase [Anaerolineaceae bacterium]
MKNHFDSILDRRNSDSGKWNRYDQDVLPLWVADMDFKSAEPILEALQKRVNHGVFGYANKPEHLIQAVIAWLWDQHQWKISPDDVIISPNVISSFNTTVQALTNPGEGILFQTPAYPPFFGVEKNAELIQQESVLQRSSNGTFSIDFEEFESRITEQTRIFLLCNPQNPTGRVFSRAELEKLAEICLKHNLYICSDEIHSDLIYSESKHIPIASLSPEIAARTVTQIAPSKTFNIAGLSTSITIIQNEEIRKKFELAKRGISGGVNLFGETAADAAYRQAKPWLEDLLVYLQDNRDFVLEYVRNELPGISMQKPEGTFLGWLDCRESKIQGNPHEFFLENARVALNDGSTFGKPGEGFVRLNFGCPRGVLIQALDQMKAALLKL